MKTFIPTAAFAVAVAAVPFAAWAQDSVDREIEQIAGVTEISQFAAVRLGRTGTAETTGKEDVDPSEMSEEDILLSGAGEQKIMTGDEPDTAATNETSESTTTGEDAAPARDDAQRTRLRTAVEQNEVLSTELNERNIDPEAIVAVEVRKSKDDTTVIVYTDD